MVLKVRETEIKVSDSIYGERRKGYMQVGLWFILVWCLVGVGLSTAKNGGICKLGSQLMKLLYITVICTMLYKSWCTSF